MLVQRPVEKVKVYCPSWYLRSQCRCSGTWHLPHSSLAFLPHSLHLDCFPAGTRWCSTPSVRISFIGLAPGPVFAPAVIPAAWSSTRTTYRLKDSWSCCPPQWHEDARQQLPSSWCCWWTVATTTSWSGRLDGSWRGICRGGRPCPYARYNFQSRLAAGLQWTPSLQSSIFLLSLVAPLCHS